MMLSGTVIGKDSNGTRLCCGDIVTAIYCGEPITGVLVYWQDEYAFGIETAEGTGAGLASCRDIVKLMEIASCTDKALQKVYLSHWIDIIENDGLTEDSFNDMKQKEGDDNEGK